MTVRRWTFLQELPDKSHHHWLSGAILKGTLARSQTAFLEWESGSLVKGGGWRQKFPCGWLIGGILGIGRHGGRRSELWHISPTRGFPHMLQVLVSCCVCGHTSLTLKQRCVMGSDLGNICCWKPRQAMNFVLTHFILIWNILFSFFPNWQSWHSPWLFLEITPSFQVRELH